MKGESGIPFALFRFATSLFSMSKLIILAIALLILWVVLRAALAVTGGFLHLLWIVAVILAVLWLVGIIRGK
jgi:hypothetical protein